MRIYAIERKTFTRTKSGYEYQIADGGELPYLYTCREKAEKALTAIIDFYVTTWHYEIQIPCGENPAEKDDCLKACRLYDSRLDFRTELRLYKIWTQN